MYTVPSVRPGAVLMSATYDIDLAVGDGDSATCVPQVLIGSVPCILTATCQAGCFDLSKLQGQR